MAPWNSDFAIIFENDRYVRVGEYFRELPKPNSGKGALSEFRYHYGPCNRNRDTDGFPKFRREVDLRIDIDTRNGRHAHYNGENHIPEDRLTGLDFGTLEPFKFVRAVIAHRQGNVPLIDILGFTVERSS